MNGSAQVYVFSEPGPILLNACWEVLPCHSNHIYSSR